MSALTVAKGLKHTVKYLIATARPNVPDVEKSSRGEFSPRLPELLRVEPTQAVSAEACPAKAVCLIERYFFPLDLEVTKQANVT
jgi:hypothetical protein